MMSKSYFITTVIPVIFAVQGTILIIYGLVTGASIIDIVIAFMFRGINRPLGVKEFYVVIGIVRTLMAIGAMNPKNNRAAMIVAGILLVFSSIGGVVYCIPFSSLNAFCIYGIVIDFIVMLTLSLFYLIYVFKRVQS